jgi:ABC-2 type transport system ATP-binding protein
MGIGILISTHNLSFGEELYDNVLILREGELKLDASRQQVKNKFGNVPLEEIYTLVNEDYYVYIEEILNEIN